MQSKINIVIVDASRKYQEILTEYLEPFGIFVIGVADKEHDLFKLLGSVKPDVIVFDLFISDGIQQLMDRLFKIIPDAKLLALSYDDEQVLIEDCLDKGIAGFYQKANADIETLADAITRVARGETVILARERQ